MWNNSPITARTKHGTMNSSEVKNPRCKLDDKCLCLSCVWFCSCLCKVCSHVSEAFLLTLRTLSLTNNSSSDSKAFLRFIAFSGSPTAVHCPLHALRYYTVGIPFWTARKRQSQTSKFDGKATIPRAQVTWSNITVMYVLRRKHCMWRNSWLRLSSFRENGFLILLHFLRCSCCYQAG